MSAPGSDARTPGFEITTAEVEDGWRIAVTGELDLLTSPRLHEAITTVLGEKRPSHVVADLAAVEFFDSSALNTLLQAQKLAEEQGIAMSVLVSPAVERIISLAGVGEHLTWTRAES